MFVYIFIVSVDKKNTRFPTHQSCNIKSFVMIERQSDNSIWLHDEGLIPLKNV